MQRSQEVRLVLIPPWLNRLLAFARVALAAALVLCVLGAPLAAAGAWLRRSGGGALALALLVLAVGAAPARGDIPSQELLDELRQRLLCNAQRFRAAMIRAGFTLAGAGHPIIPVMLGDAALAAEMADRLLDHGLYVIGFSYPVVPMGKARIRAQLSAAHSDEHIDRAVAAFAEVARELGVVA